MEEIKSSLLNTKDMQFVKRSILAAADEDNKVNFRVKTVEYINDSSYQGSDIFFYDMLSFVRFMKPSEGGDKIAFTTPQRLIYLNCPDAPNGPGEKIRVWEFIYCHECLHQLWDTFGVAKKIQDEGIEYDHSLLNIASDCVINDYLWYYRKKERFEDGIFPDVLEKNYGVQYDRKMDTQYTLYMKLLGLKKENPDKYKKMMQDPQFQGSIKPKEVIDAPPPGGGGGPQVQHSDDYIKGWTNGIKDVLDKKIDPLTYKPKKPRNDYDQGYNDVIAQIKQGIEQGIQISKNSSGGGQSGDLPDIPWDLPQQNSQDQNNDTNQSSGNASNAKQSASNAQQSANQAQKAADAAQQKADKSGDAADQAAADAAQKAADAAQKAADDAKKAAEAAADAAANGDATGEQKGASDAAEAASKAANAAADAAAAGMSSDEAVANAKQSANNAQKNADDAKAAAAAAKSKASKSGSAEDKKFAKDADEAAKNAQEAADKAAEAAKEAEDAEAQGDARGAKEAARNAKEAENISGDYKRMAENANAGKEAPKGNNPTSKTPNATQQNNGRSTPSWGHGHITGVETDAELEKIAQEAKDVIDKWQKKISGDLGKFLGQCRSASQLKREGLVVQNQQRGISAWNSQLHGTINAYVKKRIFQKKRRQESTYQRIKRGSGFIKYGQPIMPGKRVKEDKINLNIAFYVDRSGSMSNVIDEVFKAAYVISDAIKKQFGKDPLIDNTEFKMFAFDEEMQAVKWGNKASAGGGTMPFAQLLNFITKNTSDYLINVIITDAAFDIDKAKIDQLMKKIEGIIIFVTNTPSGDMKDVANTHKTQLFYIESDANFTVSK